MTTVSPAAILPPRTEARASSSRLNTRAGPRWCGGEWWATLITAPSGARFPLRMTRPPSALNGLESGRTTSCPGRRLARRVHGGDRVVPDRGQADHLHDHRHRVGRVLAPAGARSRARHGFQLSQLTLGHLPGADRADRLEEVADRHRAVAPV